MGKLLTINKVNVKNKIVLLRIDLNSSVINRKVLESERFSVHAETIKDLKKRKAKVVVLAHQGRPGAKDFVGLKQHAKLLSKYTKIRFVPDVIGTKAVNAINSLKNGEALLLDNIRKVKSEFHPGKNNLVKVLSSVSDIYVQDAFSIVHREQTSVVSLPKVMKSYAGPVLIEELNALNKIKSPKKPIVYVLGGLKTKDYGGLIRKAKRQGARVLISSKKRKDIDNKTIKEYSNYIMGAKTVFMKGALGYIENKRFRKGTLAVLNAIANNKKAFSVLAGGSLSTLIKSARINTKKFSYVSLSGGALVKYLAGEELPGLEALRMGN